ncbi:hydantoinase/oxoprolinase family protein, partial [Neobacillus drentensis]|uniref:hydantoinase/oxoprolinase family protein n=1 Tax=Neobacillus drentensis TaxID=220684 RepID=UPI0030032639
SGTNAIVQKKGPRLGLLLRSTTDFSFLIEKKEEQEMFSEIVDNRISYLNPNLQDEELEENVVKSMNHLLSNGANRLVVSLSGPNYKEEERKIRKIILNKYPRHLLGAVPVLFSHELVEDSDDKRRTWSSLCNSFLHPTMERFLYNAENVLRSHRAKNPLLIFQNDGNSTRVAKTTAIKTYGSGPRGGMEGTKALAKHYKIPALLTLDIGGTTSDIGLIKQEQIKEDTFGEIEGIKTSFRLSDLISVGAGGSSVFKVKDGVVTVGPESVGAAPGPASFGRGGKEATITDANLLLGVFEPHSYFGGKMKLDVERAKKVVEENIAEPLGISLEAALIKMENAYHEKIAKGLAVYQNQVENVTLLAFGGAGPMSACGTAEVAGIKEVIIPRLAAVFSAFGISFSEIAHEYEEHLPEMTEAMVQEKADQLKAQAERDMFSEGFDLSECMVETQLGIINGTEKNLYPLEVLNQNDLIQEADEVLVHLKVVKPISHFSFVDDAEIKNYNPSPCRMQSILQPSGQWRETPVFSFEKMVPGATGVGPALIEDPLFTCRVLDGWSFKVNANKDIFLQDVRGNEK